MCSFNLKGEATLIYNIIYACALQPFIPQKFYVYNLKSTYP